MKKNLLCKVTLCVMLSAFQSLAGEFEAGTLSEGACWYEQRETLKIVSFNDLSLFVSGREALERQIEKLLPGPIRKKDEMKIGLHCGGYGASLVAKVYLENKNYCLWAKFHNGAILTRSLGVLDEENSKEELCQGYIEGQFLVAINNQSVLKELKTKWAQEIKDIVFISKDIYKVVLNKEYFEKDKEIAANVEENFTGNGIRFVEFNEYRHPVGEFISLK